jgi:hypothetical protein
MKNQIPRKNDRRNSGGKCKDVNGDECQIEKLKEGVEDAADSRSCPSCGANYRFLFARDLLHLLDGYNSNTWAYNMISGAGMKPPPQSRAPGYHAAPGKWYP